MSPSTKAKALECPNCGGSVELRTFGQALSATCGHCFSVIDTKSPSLEIIERFNKALARQPVIPLGKRGKLKGDPYEVTGFQVRYITVDGVQYEWEEYVLFNPHKGYRYLVHYHGHWTDVKPIKELPEAGGAGRKSVRWMGETYRHFQTAEARTLFVLGEFPWRVVKDEVAVAEDFTAPPRSLSSETTDGEVNWSAGEYILGAEVWQAFSLDGAAPSAQGVYFNQPSPFKGQPGAMWLTFLVLAALSIAAAIIANTLMTGDIAFQRQFTFQPGGTAPAAFVTPVFDLRGRTTNVQVETLTDLRNEWMYVNYALVNDQSGTVYDFARMISTYGGDGQPNDMVVLGSIPSGRYYLRVEPEWQPDPGAPAGAMTPLPPPVNYTIRIRRDVALFWPLAVILVLLIVPPIWMSMRAAMFEGVRWSESDYGSSS